MKQKFCWLATQTKNGWRLKLCIGNTDYPIKGLLAKTEKDIKEIIKFGGIVFVHLKDNK